ncbi:MAG: putative transcriptional regulator [Chloroflexi bacterium]|jgi:DeoR family suf operon transcriptional repressor|nr:putative transcriptional regulator [Chloroflexota bacterium]
MNSPINYVLASLPETRRAILDFLKRHGEARAEAIAAAATITVSGARQHLVALERDGLLAHREMRDGPGRPKHLYNLTPAGDALFPRTYAELTNELLQYVEHEDPALLARIFDKRGRRRLDQARARMAGLPFNDQVRVVAEILDEDGYLADFEQRDDGTYVITEHNCAVLSVARRYNHACSSEIAFLQAALPTADVTRVAHQLVAGHVCAYEVRPRV